MVFAGNVDVVDVQQDAAVGPLDDLAEELPLGHFRDMILGVAGDIFDADRHFKKVARLADALGRELGGGEGVGHREQIVAVGTVDAAPAKVIGKERRPGSFDEVFQAGEVVAAQAVGRAEVHADAVLNNLVLLEDLVEDLERTAAVTHVVFGNNLEPVHLGFLGENVVVVGNAQADADAEISKAVESVGRHEGLMSVGVKWLQDGTWNFAWRKTQWRMADHWPV